MDVVRNGPWPVGSLVWQPRRDAWVLTVVAKATFLLRPGLCVIAPQQEPIADDDVVSARERAASLFLSRELVPVKPRAEFLVVGRAYAAARQPLASLTARVTVGEVSKAVEVFADARLLADGSIERGAPFTEMPLLYERAAGGPNTTNPVGMRSDGRDPHGGVPIPNLRRPGAPATAFEPIGLGPIAANWPERASKLQGAAAGWSPAELGRRPLPEGMDLAFFNVAPFDQRLSALSGTERIRLEHLHPEQVHLDTALPGLAPSTVLEGRGAGPLPVSMRADTLWIDTERGLCTLIFRGSIALQGESERGRIVVSSDAPRPSGGAALPAPADSRPRIARPPAHLAATSDLPLEARQLVKSALPFTPGAPAPASPPAVALAEPRLGASSPWGLGAGTPGPSELKPLVILEASAPPFLGRLVEPTSSPSDAPSRAPSAPAPATKIAEPGVATELVWFDPESAPRLRRKPEWRALLEALEDDAADAEFDEAVFPKDAATVEDRRDVFALLNGAAATSSEAFDALVLGCRRADGRFVPALAAFSGELELPFDELSRLRVTAATVAPIAGGDVSLNDALETTQRFLATPDLLSPPAVAEALTKRIEEAFGHGKRAVQPGYLEAQRERALLEGRCYQRRGVFGGEHLRAMLRIGGDAASTAPRAARSSSTALAAVPTYLPESVARTLPMFARFRVRLIAEVRLATDAYETHPAALKVLALARAASLAKS